MSIEDAIFGRINFKGAKEGSEAKQERVKTKAKKTTYIKGTHGSGAAKMKARIRSKK